MTDLVALAGIAASLLKLVLRVNDESEAVELIGDAQEAASLLGRLKRRKSDIPKPIPHRIEERLQAKLDGMYDRCIGQGIDINSLEPVATEVTILLNEMAQQKSLLVTAVRHPEDFPDLLKSHAVHRRSNVEERLEPYFDDLVSAVAEEYAQLAPWSPYFQEQSFNAVFDKLDELIELGQTNIEVTRDGVRDLKAGQLQIMQAINTGQANHPTTTRTFIGNRPALASNFIHREELNKLQELVFKNSTPRTVLIGMRGSGKSQLASSLAEFCENNDWSLVAWLNASSKQSLKTDIAELAFSLRIDTEDNPSMDTIVRRCLDHLRSADADDRLIILDNVTSIDDLADLIPIGKGVRVVATTTSSIGWAQQSWKHIDIGLFSDDDARELLLATTSSSDKETARIICEHLGNLPLAIAQAAATALNENWSLEQYFARLEKYSSDDVILSYPGDSYTNKVSFALLLAKESAINKLKEDVRKEADKIIYILTLLAASGVPTQWLDPFHNNSEISTTSDTNAINKHHALNALIHNSIIQQSKDTNITTIHRFQAQVIRECWSSTERNTALDTAARLLNNIISKTAKNLPATSQQHEVLTLIQQIQAISNQKHSQDIFHHANIQDTLSEIFRVVKVLGIAYAATSLDTAVSLTSQHFGNTQPSTILCQIGLGDAFANSGDTTTALEILEDAYLRSKDHLGEDNWVTLSGNIVRATTYAKKERFRKAIELAEDTYSRYVSQFSETDPQTFSTRNSLAQIYLQAGNASEAINHCLALLNSLADTNSQDLDFILTVLNNLAAAYQQDEQVSDAIEVFEYICNQPISVHKNGYHDYYICKCNLAAAYRQDHQPARAISILEQICEESKQTIGSYHSDRFHFRTLLAKWYLEDRDFTNAVKVLKTLHEDSGRTFANDSKNTLEYEHMLAFAYAEQGDFHSALPFIEHAYNSRLSTLGASDTATLESKYNFAFTLLRLNDWDRAIPLLVEALNDPHMNTDQLTDTQLNLAYAYHMQNDFTAALKTYLLARKTCQQDPDAYAEKLNYANQQISSLRAILRQTE